MLDETRTSEIKALVAKSLDKAERLWKKNHLALDEGLVARADSAQKRETVRSRIPKHEVIVSGDDTVATFIALVADMRYSSKHLNEAIGGDRPSQLQRVLYETSALLPALDQTIQYEDGAVTEYLGDGVLALFHVDDEDEGREDSIRAAFRAADNCVNGTRSIVNAALMERYSLPAIDLGVGLAMSKAVVTLIGLEGESHPTAYGRCLWKATKLSSGINEVVVDEEMRSVWPNTEGGGLRFSGPIKRREISGYIVTRSR